MTMFELLLNKRLAFMLGRRWGKTNTTLEWMKQMFNNGNWEQTTVDEADWRSALTAEEDDKVDEIIAFVESFGLESLGQGSLVAIVSKLIAALEVTDAADNSKASKVDGSDKAAPEATIGITMSDLLHQPYSAEQIERIRVLAAIAKIRKVNLAVVYGTDAHYVAENPEGVELMRDYDFRLMRLVLMIKSLQDELKKAKQSVNRANIRAAAHGDMLAVPFDTQERAKLLYAEYSKEIFGASWAGLSIKQREAWLRVARLWK